MYYEKEYRSHCVGQSVWSHILSGLSYTNHYVEFNKILHEASIPRGDVHTLKVLQLHVILQSYGLFVGRSEAIFWVKVLFWGYLLSAAEASESVYLRERVIEI